MYDSDQRRSWNFLYCWENISQLEVLMCDGLTVEELQHERQEDQQNARGSREMKFTYKRRLFLTPNEVQSLVVPASTRAVKVNKFATSSLQVYSADERVSFGH